MGTDYSSVLGVGYVLPMKDVLDPFRKVAQEKSHTEDRYDEKTGEKLKPIKVVDEEECDTFMWPGEPKSETDDYWGFVEILAEKLRCQPVIFGDHMGGSNLFVLFGIEVKPDDVSGIEDVVAGRVDFAGNLGYKSVVEAASEIKALKGRMVNLGLRPKEPVVQNCWTIS